MCYFNVIIYYFIVTILLVPFKSLAFYLTHFRKLCFRSFRSSLTRLRDLLLFGFWLRDLAEARERDLLRVTDFPFSSDEMEPRRCCFAWDEVPPRESIESDRFMDLFGASLRARRRVVDRLRPDRFDLSADDRSSLPTRRGERR